MSSNEGLVLYIDTGTQKAPDLSHPGLSEQPPVRYVSLRKAAVHGASLNVNVSRYAKFCSTSYVFPSSDLSVGYISQGTYRFV